jgi:hypothetical protein
MVPNPSYVRQCVIFLWRSITEMSFVKSFMWRRLLLFIYLFLKLPFIFNRKRVKCKLRCFYLDTMLICNQNYKTDSKQNHFVNDPIFIYYDGTSVNRYN